MTAVSLSRSPAPWLVFFGALATASLAVGSVVALAVLEPWLVVVPAAALLVVVVTKWPTIGIFGQVIVIVTATPAVLADRHGLEHAGLATSLVLLVAGLTAAYRRGPRERTGIRRLTETLDARAVGVLMVIAAWVGLTALGLATAHAPSMTAAPVADTAEIGAHLAPLVLLVRNRTQLHAALWALTVTGLVVGGAGVHAALTGDAVGALAGHVDAVPHRLPFGLGDTNRLISPLAPASFLPTMLAVAALVAVNRALRETRTVMRRLAGTAAVAAGAATLLTFSPVAVVTVGVGTVWAAHRAQRRLRPRQLVLVTGAACAVIAAPALTGPVPHDPSVETDTAAATGATSSVGDGLDLVAANPVLGVGAGGYETAVAKSSSIDRSSSPEQRQAPSQLLQMGAERGVVGLASFGAVLAVAGNGIALARRRADGFDPAVVHGDLDAVASALAAGLVVWALSPPGSTALLWLVVIVALLAPTAGLERRSGPTPEQRNLAAVLAQRA